MIDRDMSEESQISDKFDEQELIDKLNNTHFFSQNLCENENKTF